MSCYSHFFSKNTAELDIVLTRTVNILTTNELVTITMLWATGPWSISQNAQEMSLSRSTAFTRHEKKVRLKTYNNKTNITHETTDAWTKKNYNRETAWNGQQKNCCGWGLNPANTQRFNNVVTTSWRCSDVVTTLLRRRCLLGNILYSRETSLLILIQLQPYICSVRLGVYLIG